MRTTRHRPRRTAALLAALALSALTAAPAAAHDELVAVSPEPGAVLETAPEQIELTFSGEVMEIGPSVSVTDSAGRSVTGGPLEQEGTRVSQPLAGTGSGDETYHVVWRVVSSDGHPIDGTFSYDVGAGAPAPAADASTGATGAPGAQAGEAAPGGGGAVPLGSVAAAGAVLALAVLGAVRLTARRRAR